MNAVKKTALAALTAGCTLLPVTPAAAGDAVLIPIPCPPETLWLQADAPAFGITIPVMREQFNRNNPSLPLREYKVVASNDITASYLRAATRIRARLVFSAALSAPGSSVS